MPQPRKHRPTISDVAEVAHVSRGTVSRVLNGGHWVSREAAEAVEAAIRSTGYRVNAQARGLATNRTGSVAFLLNETTGQLFSDPNFSTIISGVAEDLRAHGQTLVLLLATTPEEEVRAEEYLLAGHVDGALLVSWHTHSRGILRHLHQAGFPLVACGVPLGMETQISWVQADDYGGARAMTAHLLARGYRRIAHIGGPGDTSGGLHRLEGYRDALADSFDPALVVQGDYSADSGRAAMARLLEVSPRVDAVFAANDLMAVGAMVLLHERGLSIPGDVAVAGFDDSEAAASAVPTLTTMRQPFEQISQEMSRLLRDQIDGRARATLTLGVELVERESA